MFKNFFKQLNNKKEQSKFEYLTLEEMKEELKSGIVVLENRYFKIEKIEIDEEFKELEERDKEIEIESVLEDRINNYNPIEYIEKEIELEEKIIIILLERVLVDKILEEIKEKKIQIFGIIPAFLLRTLELKNKSNSIEKFIDVDRKNSVIVDIKGGKIKDISIIEIDKEQILESEKEDIVRYIFEIDLNELNYLSFYEKDREIGERFENIENISIKINSWSDEKVEYNYEYDFLPMEYLENLKQNRFIKKIVFISVILFILIISLGFLFQYFLNIKSEKIEKVEKEIINFEDSIEQIKEKILEIDETKKLREDELKKIEFKNLKLSEILNSIDNFKPIGVNILNIELLNLDNKNKIKIIGNSINDKKILNFQEKIINSNKFKNINHDYIRKIGDIYEFQIEAEVYS